MAYSPSTNSPILTTPNISTKIRTGTNSVVQSWYYNSADSLATVQGSGYFTNGKELNMLVGDIVRVAVSGVLKTPDQYVSAVDATTGAATISVATV